MLTCRLEDSGQDAGAATKAGVVKGFTSIPFAAHGFAVVANIPGVSELVLDMPTVRAIMNGWASSGCLPASVPLEKHACCC